ncbi:MAG TPA: hypothetical protein VMW79_07745 [Anaerolineae bacterium]|nr:hypothetical protein [Anaerolineae bacterium]
MTCPVCGGQGCRLDWYRVGEDNHIQHDAREWYRCRQCGCDFMREDSPEPEDEPEDEERVMWSEQTAHEWLEDDTDRKERDVRRSRHGRPSCIPVY